MEGSNEWKAPEEPLEGQAAEVAPPLGSDAGLSLELQLIRQLNEDLKEGLSSLNFKVGEQRAALTHLLDHLTKAESARCKEAATVRKRLESLETELATAKKELIKARKESSEARKESLLLKKSLEHELASRSTVVPRVWVSAEHPASSTTATMQQPAGQPIPLTEKLKDETLPLVLETFHPWSTINQIKREGDQEGAPHADTKQALPVFSAATDTKRSIPRRKPTGNGRSRSGKGVKKKRTRVRKTKSPDGDQDFWELA